MKKKQSKKNSQSEISSKRSKTGKTAVQKGKQFERELANILGHIFPDAARHLEYQAFEASEGVDLQGTDIFKIQAKNRQGYAPISKIFEVKKLNEGDIPVLITKGNRLPPMAVVPLSDFIYLVEVLYGITPQRNKLSSLVKHNERAKGLLEAIEVKAIECNSLSVDDLI